MTRPLTRPIPRPAGTGGGDPSGPVPFSRRRTRVLLGLAAIVVVAALVGALFVLPVRAWMNQREAIAEAEAQKDALWTQIRELDERYVALESDGEVERIAREQYGLVFPGEQPLSVLPTPTIEQLPAAWPYTVVEEILAVRTATGALAGTAVPGVGR
jgi:hypothetical protein